MAKVMERTGTPEGLVAWSGRWRDGGGVAPGRRVWQDVARFGLRVSREPNEKPACRTAVDDDKTDAALIVL